MGTGRVSVCAGSVGRHWTADRRRRRDRRRGRRCRSCRGRCGGLSERRRWRRRSGLGCRPGQRDEGRAGRRLLVVRCLRALILALALRCRSGLLRCGLWRRGLLRSGWLRCRLWRRGLRPWRLLIRQRDERRTGLRCRLGRRGRRCVSGRLGRCLWRRRRLSWTLCRGLLRGLRCLLRRGLRHVRATGLLVPVRGRVDRSGPVLILGAVAETVLAAHYRHRHLPDPPLAQL